MKKVMIFILSVMFVLLTACSSNATENTNNKTDKTKSNIQTIETVTNKNGKPQKVSTKSTQEYITAKREGKAKTTKKQLQLKKKKENATAEVYEMQIKYSSLSDYKKKVVKYKTFKDLMKSVDEKNNNASLNPFRQENLFMIFEEKTAFVPKFPKGCKFKKCYLSSRNFFCFGFKDLDKKEQNIKIYTVNNNNELKTNKFSLSFKSKKGVDIYKNAEGKYCWFLDDKYVVTYSGKSRDLINQLSFTTLYID